MLKRVNTIICVLVMLCTVFIFPKNNVLSSEWEVKVGKGSYSTVLPPGAENVLPTIYRTNNLKGPMSTNDWWSSTAFLRYSERQYPHPLAVINKKEGIQVYYPGPSIFANKDAICGWMNLPEDTPDDFTIGHSQVQVFPDTRWMYRAMSDPADAINQMEAGIDDSSNWLEAGNSKAHTYHWIHNFNAVGHVYRNVTSSHPVYAVFNKEGKKTYVAYNYGNSPITVSFSDGKTMNVPPGSMAVSAEEATGESLVIDDFNSSAQWDSAKNDLGEKIIRNGGLYNLEANTNLYFFYNGGNSPESFDTYINRDISSYSHLVLNIKGGSGGEEKSVRIILNDGSNHGVSLSDYGNLTTEYKEIKIPLKDFGANLKNVNYLRIEGTGTAKVLRIEEIRLSKTGTVLVYGDLDGDGIINSNDYVLISRYILEVINNLPGPYAKEAADLNGDGRIDTLDAAILKRYLLEIINEFPVGNYRFIILLV